MLLVGGWQLAAARQRGGFDQVSHTISELAGRGATDPWIMTTALAGVGMCHVITAAGLAPAAIPGRLLLAAGGVGTAALAALPLPVIGDSPAHVVAATVTFPALSLWPVLAVRRGSTPRPAVWLSAAAGLLVLLGWFGIGYFGGSSRIGLSERMLAAAQALWPLAAVLLARRR